MTNSEALLIAHRKGYRVRQDGKPVNRIGMELVASGHNGYLGFSVSLPGRKTGHVKVHRLHAFQKFGCAVFEPGIQVRHLNGNCKDNSEGNIGIGSISENIMDMPPAVRLAKSRKANLANVKYNHSAVRDFYRGCASYKKTMQEFGIQSTATLHNILSK